jgi:hypothetical protein
VQVPSFWQARCDTESINVRAQPPANSESFSHDCWRCASPMPLLTPHDACTSCGAPIVRSFATFEPLPVVEFELADGITDEEASALLASEPQLRSRCALLVPTFQASQPNAFLDLLSHCLNMRCARSQDRKGASDRSMIQSMITRLVHCTVPVNGHWSQFIYDAAVRNDPHCGRTAPVTLSIHRLYS